MDPITILIIAASMLLSGGGVYVYEENKRQKEVEELTDKIIDLQKKINEKDILIQKLQAEVNSLQDQLAMKERSYGVIVAKLNHTQQLYLHLSKEVTKKSSFFAKVIAALKWKLQELRMDNEILAQKLREAENTLIKLGNSKLFIETSYWEIHDRKVKLDENITTVNNEKYFLFSEQKQNESRINELKANI